MSFTLKKETWTSQDLVEGRCSLDEVGMPITPDVEPRTGELDKDAILDKLVENSVTPKTQAGFNKWAEANPHSYYPMLAKHNLARLAKEQIKSLPDIAVLTEAEIEAYSSNDVKRMLLKSVGVTTKQQADELLKN